jgi:Holliday junction resolvase RusA-like endonuclease
MNDTMNLNLSAAVTSTERLLSSGATTTASLIAPRKIEFVIPGKVIGKGRPHFVKKTGVAITPQQTRSYESLIRDVVIPLMAGQKPWEGCVKAHIVAYYKVPKSWSKKDTELATKQMIPPGKPDVDNVVKILLDSLSRWLYLDDKQVCDCRIIKMWSTEDSLYVCMEEM